MEDLASYDACSMAGRKRAPRKQAPRKQAKQKRRSRPAPGEKEGDKTLAERLVLVRKRVGLTRVEVSARTGVNYESLSGYELGQEHTPFRRIRLLAMFYGCSLDYLGGISNRLAIKKAAAGRRRAH